MPTRQTKVLDEGKAGGRREMKWKIDRGNKSTRDKIKKE